MRRPFSGWSRNRTGLSASSTEVIPFCCKSCGCEGVMRVIATYSVMVALMAAAMAATMSAGARDQEPAALTVRLYNAAGISAPELVASRRAPEPILQDTGLHVTFRQCGRPVIPEYGADACAESLTPSEVVVRVIDAP